MFWIRLKTKASYWTATNELKGLSETIIRSDQIEVLGSHKEDTFFIRMKSGLMLFVFGDMRKFLLEYSQADVRSMLSRNEIVDFTELI